MLCQGRSPQVLAKHDPSIAVVEQVLKDAESVGEILLLRVAHDGRKLRERKIGLRMSVI